MAVTGAPASYTTLPLSGHRLAPPRFTGDYRDLERFITHFEHVCAQYNVTDDDQKCLGIVRYCSYKIADFIEALESYRKKDYNTLLTKLRWHFDEERKKSEYDLEHLEEVIDLWQDKAIRDLETFKEYEYDFIRVADQLKNRNQITDQEYDRKFWEGLHDTTRDDLERRMKEVNSSLKTDVPFSHDDIVAAADHVYSRVRFDKYLQRRRPLRTGRDREEIRKRIYQRRGRSTDTEPEDSDKEEKTSRSSKRNLEIPKTTRTPKSEATKVKTDKDEIAELVKGMEGLSISQPSYRTLYARLLTLSREVSALYPAPPVLNARVYPSQNTRFAMDERPRRDPPPHQMLNVSEVRSGERREFTCFGCGERGHRMDQCIQLEKFIDQGHVRRIAGRLRWSDGSNIFREPEETWASAIGRRIQLERSSTDTGDSGQKIKGIYLLSIRREDDDADTDYQEELGWSPGTTAINNLQAYAVERTPRVSRETRKTAQKNVPANTHRVAEFATRRHEKIGDGKKGSIAKDPGFHRNQDKLFRRTTTPTPIDVSQEVFEGKLDDELVPMDIEEPVRGKRGEDRRKVAAREGDRPIGNVAQSRAKKEEAQEEVVNEVLQLPLTLTLQNLVSISPIVQRGLARALKTNRDSAEGPIDKG